MIIISACTWAIYEKTTTSLFTFLVAMSVSVVFVQTHIYWYLNYVHFDNTHSYVVAYLSIFSLPLANTRSMGSVSIGWTLPSINTWSINTSSLELQNQKHYYSWIIHRGTWNTVWKYWKRIQTLNLRKFHRFIKVDRIYKKHIGDL